MRKKKQLWLRFLLSVALLFPSLFVQKTAKVEAAMASYQANFIQTLAPTAVLLGKQYGLFPSIMLAQAILESDWGRSGLASAPYYNLFGIKSPDGDTSGVVFSTQEDDGTGQLYTIRDSFRRYNSINESMYDYAKLFRSTPFLERHYANFLNASTVQEAAMALTGTYATDTNYGRSLMNIIVAYNLLQYDTSVGRGPSWALTPTQDIVYVTHNDVNLRRSHSTSEEPVGRAQANDKFFRLGYVTGWSLLQLADGSQLYIATQFLRNTPLEDEPAGRDFTVGIQRTGNAVSSTETAVNVTEEKTGTSATTESSSAAEEEKPARIEDLYAFSGKFRTEAVKENIVDEAGHTAEEVEKAKALADQAIANQNNNPSTAPKAGVIDTRTVVDKKNTTVNKKQLEALLTSDINLPFVSEESKAAYAKLLQEAKAAYYHAQATQTQVDQLVKKLQALKEEAKAESAEGTQKDLEEVRTVTDTSSQVELFYNKLAIDKENLKMTVQMQRKADLDKEAVEQLYAIGEKLVQYNVVLEDASGTALNAQQKVQLFLPIPSDMQAEQVLAYRIKDSFTLIALPFQLSEDKTKILLEEKEMGAYLLLEKRLVSQRTTAGVVYAEEGLESVGKNYPHTFFGTPLLILLAGFLLVRILYLLYTQKMALFKKNG